MKMKRFAAIVMMALFLCVSATACYSSEHKNNGKNHAKHKPKLILYSFINPMYLRDTAKSWAENTGFRGFMIAYICDWEVPDEKVLARVPELKTMNEECRKYGIDSNFIKLSMGHLKDMNWSDDAYWKKLDERVRLAAKIAKETGFVGIALDTEPYNWRENSIWDVGNPMYKHIERNQLETLVRKRGRDFMEAVKSEFPEAQFIIFPEGYFYYKYPSESVNDTARIYNTWGYFFKGLCDAELQNGINVGTERTYHMTDPDKLRQKYESIVNTMKECPENRKYWEEKCSVAIGMAPLGKKFDDKRKRYYARDFDKQINEAVKLSPRYLWVYGHGGAWWQLEDDTPYVGKGFTFWRPAYQKLKCDRDIQKFYDITKAVLPAEK
ncbi:MAG: hypothetical protein LWY06_12005 [Firmicutes bacterium]|nr:hypothetical protein [Bacillota bacterium]